MSGLCLEEGQHEVVVDHTLVHQEAVVHHIVVPHMVAQAVLHTVVQVVLHMVVQVVPHTVPEELEHHNQAVPVAGLRMAAGIHLEVDKP